MPTLHITRGLPGSGKSTWARAWVAEDRAHRARVNRDDLRGMVDAGEFIDRVTEPRIIAIRNAAIRELLAKNIDVAVDDTNLPARVVRDLVRIARQAGAAFEVHDFTAVPLQTCLDRDALRTTGCVGPRVIADMHTRYLKGRELPLLIPEEPAAEAAEPNSRYEPKPGTPPAVLVDIDGTTALMAARSPFDETRVHEDRPNAPVISVIRAMHQAGHRVVFLSGRTAACHEATKTWLNEHVGVPFDGLFMREVGDFRKDSIVKTELFDRHVRDTYMVVCVLDDRRQVVDAWRAMGLTVLQVAEGDF